MRTLSLLVAFCTVTVLSAGNPSEKSARPKLGVVIVFDQMRGDYLIKWKDLFVEGGFKRLQTEGAWFTNCHYPYSDTVTAAGHTSLLTGCTPREHGIIANSWYERETGKRVQAVSGLLGPDPMRRRRPTLGDFLLDATGGKGKVASLSIKDRAAILMAALRAQIVYWLSEEDQFETSPHYREGIHSWVRDYNQTGKTTAGVGKAWNRLRPDLDYTKFTGPDNFRFEGTGYDQGRTFPHPTPDTWAQAGSPYGNELLLDFAKVAIEKEKLGQTDETDLLCLSFSANDLIGHSFGPDSQEVLDITLRSDLIVKELLDFLDVKVGKGNYFVAMAADHGICPLPEASKSLHNKEASRVLDTLLSSQAEKFLRSKFGSAKTKWIETTSNSWIYLNQATIDSRRRDRHDVEEALASWLMAQPGVERAFTRTQLMKETMLPDVMLEQVKLSFCPKRSGDVTVVLKPYHLLWETASTRGGGPSTTTHGSPYFYDTHVPLLIFGPGIKPGIIDQRVVPQTLAPIMARGLCLPGSMTTPYAVPPMLFKTPNAAE